ncbi:hypothetical protein D3C87_1138740 [compost metagenome]|mgnify:FL=1|uniref:hypothetical protein n=1 Tax=Aeromonas TaxID=642 RepID=UPI000F977D71|nr:MULTISPECIES: hypothetical protein [Aeromonas]
MPNTPLTIASEIDEIMRKNGNEGITLKWEQFYKICDREKLAEVILEKIRAQLKKRDIHIVYAGSNVIVVRDFCWKPVTI